MKHINVDIGIQERMNDLIGRNPSGLLIPNDWSVQGNMLANMRRIGKSLNFLNQNGCVLSGEDVVFRPANGSPDSGVLRFSDIVAVTKSGNFIVMPNDITFTTGQFNFGTERFLALSYEVCKVMTGHSSQFQNTVSDSIEYDDRISSASTVGEISTMVKVVTSIDQLGADDVLICSIKYIAAQNGEEQTEPNSSGVYITMNRPVILNGVTGQFYVQSNLTGQGNTVMRKLSFNNGILQSIAPSL